MPFKINFKSLILYALYAACIVLINFALPKVPLSFGILFAMLICGTNIIADGVLYVLASAVELNLIYSALALFEAGFLCAVVFLYRRAGRKLGFEGAVFALIALAPYVIFCDWTGFGAPSGINPYIMKSIAAAVCAAFAFFAFKSVYALLFRLYRCRLREDELVCLAVTYCAVGVGFLNLAGEGFYIALSAAAAIFFTRLCRSPASLGISIVFALPHVIKAVSFEPLTSYIIIWCAAWLFLRAGRWATAVIVAALSAGYTYLTGGYFAPVPIIVLLAFALIIACILPALAGDKRLKELKMRLNCESELYGTAIERSRKRTGERLYRISELFREIERAFNDLDEDVDEEALRNRIFIQLKEKKCKNCEYLLKCNKSGVNSGIKRLIDAGCARGKVNLIDLPSEVSAGCHNSSELLNELNGILAEYRRFAAESENARAGRRLLADQAHGVAEVIKGCAVDLFKARESFEESEKEIAAALASNGISCPEVEMNGVQGEISAAICGKADVNAVCAIISNAVGRRYVLKDKIVYNGQKTCLIFTPPPKMDAAFGVAYKIKQGERASGDTHSVIRINERAFLMALSDGMGSGEYAKKVSEAAISLIEAFYRAEMPQDTVLKTINKLLSFNRDERFTCIDIAAVNLETGRADFVKIGSPAGIIVREGEIKVLESLSLPLGILENLHPTTCSLTLKSGDIIVFMSDGVTSAFPSSTELYEFLEGLKPLNPQSLADKILKAALSRTNGVASDDMTVVCTRLFENG